ncbi:unnamed protein product, partial [marine sediment metagenome]
MKGGKLSPEAVPLCKGKGIQEVEGRWLFRLNR